MNRMFFCFLLLFCTAPIDLIFADVHENMPAPQIAHYKGQVVYLDFWASWCGPCRESFPWLNHLVRKYPKLKIIGINLDKEKSKAVDFLEKYPAQFEIIYDPSGKLAEKYKVKGMPYSVVIDKKNNVRHSHIGFSSKDADSYTKIIKSLIEEN